MNDSAIANLLLSERRLAYCVADRELKIIHRYDPHGLLSADQQGDSLFDLLPELIGSDQALAELLAGELQRFELGRVQRIDDSGAAPIVRLVCMPTRDTAGAITGLVQLIEDVTEIGETERNIAQQRNELRLLQEQLSIRNARLSEANLQLERAVKVREEFLAAMSHELRTPLTAVLGMTELLQRGICGPTNDDQGDALRVIAENGRHLLELINDILDYAKVEASRLDLNLATIQVDELCHSVIRMVMPMARKKHLTVHLEIDPRAVVLEADQRRLKQILINLLGNAVKFTPDEGRIGLDVVADLAQQQLHFIVWDNGIGIAEHELQNLFQPFVQLESGAARKYVGTGLGLALVRQLATLHGGSVSVSSTPGRGSRFTVTLPWVDAPPGAPPIERLDAPESAERALPLERALAAGPHPAELPLVLVASADAELCQTIETLLDPSRYRVGVAASTAQAIELAIGQPPDLLLVDSTAQAVDGLAICRAARADARTAELPIVLITEGGGHSLRAEGFRAGADDFLSKPLDTIELEARIHTITKLNRYRQLLVERAQAAERLERSNQELVSAYDATLQSWTDALELRDHETEGHCRRVRDLTIELARSLGVPEEELPHIRRGAILHDIGKIGIPDDILFKPSALTFDERRVLERHPVYAYKILEPIEYLRPSLDIPYYHHERWDGSGYPCGLRGQEIPLAARIFAVADVYDALCSDRPHRSGWPESKVFAYLREQAGSQFDPDVVEAFLRLRQAS